MHILTIIGDHPHLSMSPFKPQEACVQVSCDILFGLILKSV
jgi:hypothetical protein